MRQCEQLNMAPEQLLPDLQKLKQEVQEVIDVETNFRKANSRFDVQNKTTQLLLAACERLAEERAEIEMKNFEEHSARLEYLCKQYGTVLDAGLPDTSYRKQGGGPPPTRQKSRSVGRRAVGAWIFGQCCQADFPPNQHWWLDIVPRLQPTFRVLRTGNLVAVPGPFLQPGDIVHLHAGQKAAADGRVLVISAGTILDASQVTARANDVRVCCCQPTAPSAAESRNMVLKDSHLVIGSLFCMVVRTPAHPITPTVGESRNNDEFAIDVSIPQGLSMRQCQNVFKALCVKAQMVPKSFNALSRLKAARVLLVLLNQALLKKGTVPQFCASMQKLGRSVVLVDSGCGINAMNELCEKLGIRCVNFLSDQASPRTAGEGGGSGKTGPDALSEVCTSEAETPVDFASSINVSVCAGPLNIHHVSENDHGLLRSLMDTFKEPAPQKGVVAAVSGASQEVLFLLCRFLHTPKRPMLYAMTDFNFPRCLTYLPCQEVFAPHCSVVSVSAVSTSAGVTPSHAGTCVEQQSERSADAALETSERPTTNTIANARILSAAQECPVPHVLISMNSIGVVSEKADCIVLEEDLILLGQAIEIVDAKVPLTR